jgi:hypothetical protein
MNINPLNFLDNSRIIKYNNQSQSEGVDEKQEFLRVLLEKVFLKSFTFNGVSKSEDDEGNPFFSNVSNDIVNDMFKSQLASQIIESDLISIDNDSQQDQLDGDGRSNV